MPVSEREKTAVDYILCSQNSRPAQQIEELASLSQETHRIPDPYHYLMTPQGEILSPSALCRVKDTIDDKTSPLGQLEYQAVLATEQWAANAQEGVSVWISPPKVGIYPNTKIIIQEIENEGGVKKIFNRAIVLDINEQDCMKFAWNLTSFTRNKPIFRNVDEIRATPLIFDFQKKSWVDILETLIDAPKVWDMIRNGQDKQYKKEALRQAAGVQKQFFSAPALSYSEDARIAVMKMLGEKAGSCPLKPGSNTAFQTIAGSALTMNISGDFIESDQYGSLEFECPNPLCKKINRRPKGELIPNCQHCKADVRC